MITPDAVGPALVRTVNERVVLRSMRDGRSMRVSEIAAITGLTRVSTGSILTALIERGWVTEEASETLGRGRPARMFAFRARAGAAIGVDIGAFSARLVVTDMAGSEIARGERPTTPTMPMSERWSVIGELAQSVLADAGLHDSDVWATMIACTGFVDPVTGHVPRASAIPDLAGTTLPLAARGILPGLLIAENDVRAATFAEQRAGVARDASVLMHVVLGRRPSVGLAIEGELFRGAHLIAGDLDRAAVPTLLAEGDPLPAPLAGADDPFRELLTATGRGEAWAVDHVRDYAGLLGPTLGVLSDLVDPEKIVIGGPIATVGEPVRAEIERAVLRSQHVRPEVVLSSFDTFVSATGAALMAVAHLDRLILGDGRESVPAFAAPE